MSKTGWRYGTDFDNSSNDSFVVSGNSMNCGLRHQITTFLVSLAIATLTVVGLISSPALALDYNEGVLIGEDFSGRVLTDASFTRAKLRDSNFSHADLRGVSFFGAHLEHANLEAADLTNAVISKATFTKANLTNAILEGAFAFNAKFDGAIVDGADFTDVLLRDDQLKILCQVAQGTNPVTGRETRETLDCP